MFQLFHLVNDTIFVVTCDFIELYIFILFFLIFRELHVIDQKGHPRDFLLRRISFLPVFPPILLLNGLPYPRGFATSWPTLFTTQNVNLTAFDFLQVRLSCDHVNLEPGRAQEVLGVSL